ncbi:hypothetical protein ABZS95_36980 [Streptomyces sp. NPDC005479]|uniref:hypothetical protein n=1 Tax=Streptomyces sp. NPDC005479 TaxID=3154879 RepID=UPI0033A694CE
MSTEPPRSLRYVDNITRDDVLALEAFIYSQLQPVQDAADETGDTFCALRSLEPESAGLMSVDNFSGNEEVPGDLR